MIHKCPQEIRYRYLDVYKGIFDDSFEIEDFKPKTTILTLYISDVWSAYRDLNFNLRVWRNSEQHLIHTQTHIVFTSFWHLYCHQVKSHLSRYIHYLFVHQWRDWITEYQVILVVSDLYVHSFWNIRIFFAIITNTAKTLNINCTLVGNKIVDHSDVVGVPPVGAAPTTSSSSTGLQWTGQRHLQDETRNI